MAAEDVVTESTENAIFSHPYTVVYCLISSSSGSVVMLPWLFQTRHFRRFGSAAIPYVVRSTIGLLSDSYASCCLFQCGKCPPPLSTPAIPWSGTSAFQLDDNTFKLQFYSTTLNLHAGIVNSDVAHCEHQAISSFTTACV